MPGTVNHSCINVNEFGNLVFDRNAEASRCEHGEHSKPSPWFYGLNIRYLGSGAGKYHSSISESLVQELRQTLHAIEDKDRVCGVTTDI